MVSVLPFRKKSFTHVELFFAFIKLLNTGMDSIQSCHPQQRWGWVVPVLPKKCFTHVALFFAFIKLLNTGMDNMSPSLPPKETNNDNPQLFTLHLL